VGRLVGGLCVNSALGRHAQAMKARRATPCASLERCLGLSGRKLLQDRHLLEALHDEHEEAERRVSTSFSSFVALASLASRAVRSADNALRAAPRAPAKRRSMSPPTSRPSLPLVAAKIGPVDILLGKSTRPLFNALRPSVRAFAARARTARDLFRRGDLRALALRSPRPVTHQRRRVAQAAGAWGPCRRPCSWR